MGLIEMLPPLAQRILCSLYVYPALGVNFISVWIVQVLYLLAVYPFTTPEERYDGCGHIFRYISYLIIDKWNPFWHVHVLNDFPRALNHERNRPDRKVILMMPHLSSADPFLSIRSFLPRDGSWIAKGVLFKVPFGGWAMGNSDDLPVYFLDKHQHSTALPTSAAGGAGEEAEEGEGEERPVGQFTNNFELEPGTAGPMLERARAKLRRGRMLCVFPEGTRSEHADRKNFLEPFRQGFFDLALEEGALIVPLGITGTNRVWPRGSVLTCPAHCYFSFGDVIDARGFSSAFELAACVRRELIRLRESHPDRLSA